MKKNPDNLRSKANSGFSLVDVMVGMVIALLGTIIIFQVFSVSEGIKRTTTSGGDALQNGAAALSALENSLKMAGYGFFTYASGTTPATVIATAPAPPASYAPVLITTGADATGGDSITLTYRLDGRLAVAGNPCNAGNVVTATGNPNWDFGAFPPDPVVFPPPAPAPPALTVETISVQLVDPSGNLVATTGSLQPRLCSNIYGVIADGIVLMKAEYGVATAGVVPSGGWTQVAPANMLNVLAVRLAVVARSAKPEDVDANGNHVASAACTTGLVAPLWIDSPTVALDITGGVGLAATDSYACYRYKTFENTVPLRNVM